MKNQPLVSIMILGWNNYSDLINCHKSLCEISYRNFNVVLVDNGSREAELGKFFEYLNKSKTKYQIIDNNPDKVFKARTESGCIYIALNKKNIGFAGGSNLGFNLTFKICDPQYLLLLNGDTKVDPDFLSCLVEVCESDKKIGSAQSLLIRFDKKTIDSLGITMEGWRAYDRGTGLDKSTLNGAPLVEEIFGACGAGALYRSSLIKKFGLFDEKLFATFEDFDLAWRIRLANYKSVLVYNSIVYHRGGVSRRKSKGHKVFDLRTYYPARNSLVLFNRYYPWRLSAIPTSAVRFAIALVSAVKNHRFFELTKIIFAFPKERKSISKNPRLRDVQKRWIS